MREVSYQLRNLFAVGVTTPNHWHCAVFRVKCSPEISSPRLSPPNQENEGQLLIKRRQKIIMCPMSNPRLSAPPTRSGWNFWEDTVSVPCPCIYPNLRHQHHTLTGKSVLTTMTSIDKRNPFASVDGPIHGFAERSND